ncbi:MAG: elongation factor P [Syntrophobacterales bacterium]|nr:MAG: elongation factor P [Syntrophobacterales bacterium]
MPTTSEFRKGLKIELDGEPFIIIDFQHVKPGKGGAFLRTKLKSLLTGNILEQTFRSGERVRSPDIEEKEVQYLYQNGENYYFMDKESYWQFELTEDQLGSNRDFLQENVTVTVLFHNKNPIGVELPIFVEIRIERTEPGVRGDTASGGTKPARLETGAVVQVPLFLEEGDIIKIDTRTGEYVERITK